MAALAAVGLLVTMFFPWYELQSLNPKTHAIDSRSISAFGDVSFVEAAVFLVAAGVIALLFARAERRDFRMPGSDGTVVMVAGGWATWLIFYRVFSRPAGHGYPVGIEWGFFLAFVAAGALTWAGWRMRAASPGEPPLVRRRPRMPAAEGSGMAQSPRKPAGEGNGMAQRSQAPARTTPSPPNSPAPVSPSRTADPPRPAPERPKMQSKRPRYPPPPGGQLSFEDEPTERRG